MTGREKEIARHGIERLGVDLDGSELDLLPKHPAERWLSRRHIAVVNDHGRGGPWLLYFPRLCG